jgi:hypothetical protein
MNSLLAVLLTKVVRESGDLCGIDTTRDLETISSRVEHEGLSFLTITLPIFFKDLQRSLDRGYIAEDLFRPFSRRKNTKLPSFLGGFLRLVFDEGDGRLLDGVHRSESVDAIRCMFQITGLLKKVELDCSDARIKAALTRYVENDAHVLAHRDKVSIDMVDEFVKMGNVLFGDVFAQVNREIDEEQLRPVHGPGATAANLRETESLNLSCNPGPLGWKPFFRREDMVTPHIPFIWKRSSGELQCPV